MRFIFALIVQVVEEFKIVGFYFFCALAMSYLRYLSQISQSDISDIQIFDYFA